LSFQGKKYIIEIKVNRHNDIGGIIEEGLLQLTDKYLATESTSEGYLVIFDTKQPVGEVCRTQTHPVGDKLVTSFTIAIGEVEKKEGNVKIYEKKGTQNTKGARQSNPFQEKAG